jgi:mannose-6-phosphate isomerase-like protein (cupin superfamily)
MAWFRTLQPIRNGPENSPEAVMIRRNGEYPQEIRSQMRGGEGQCTIEKLWLPGDELKGGFRLFARLTIPPGASIGFHRHENEEEVFVVLQGIAKMDDNGQEVMLHPGDTIHTGGGAGHAVACAGNEPLVMLAVIATME